MRAAAFGGHIHSHGADRMGLRGTTRRVRKLVRYAWPYKGRSAVAIAALLGATAATIAGPVVVKLAIDQGITPGDYGRVEFWVGVYLVVALAGWAVGIVQSYLTSWVGERMLTDLRQDLFGHLQTLDLGYFERTKAGVVISRVTNDIEALNSLVTDGPTTLIQNTITLVGSAVVLLYIDWRLALATLTVFPGMAIGTMIFRHYSARAYRRTRERLAEVTASLQEDISGVRVIQAFRREHANYRRFTAVNDEYRQANMTTVNASALYFPYVSLLSGSALAVVLGYGGTLVFEGRLSAGDLFVFIGLLANFFDPVQQLSQFYQQFLAGMAALDKIFDVMDTEPGMTDSEGAEPLSEIAGEVRFEHVHFSYGGDVEVLHDVDFTVRAGQTVALVGHTGAGKSTLVKLLTRFYDPSAGRVIIDG
ncbi:MAG: ABC transporter ATP-binding protein, partial [Gaiellales bacterium]